MAAESPKWDGYEVYATHARWVCIKSRAIAVPSTADGVDYLLVFSAHDKRFDDVPDTRTLQLRTSEFLIGTDWPFLKLVVDGELLDGKPWDRFKEICKRD
jgi:hypothetical protein